MTGSVSFGGNRRPEGLLDFRPNNVQLPKSLSQPCLTRPLPEEPSEILPFVIIGSSVDASTPKTLKAYRITHVLNVTTHSPPSSHVAESNFLRISINDDYSSNILPHLDEAFDFIDKVRKNGGRILIHCMAGISRSPAIVIAYLMKYLRLSADEALKFVKQRRPAVSPNFHFLGQLIKFEKTLKEGFKFDKTPSVGCLSEINTTSTRRSWSFDDLFVVHEQLIQCSSFKRQNRMYSSVGPRMKHSSANLALNCSREVLCA